MKSFSLTLNFLSTLKHKCAGDKEATLCGSLADDKGIAVIRMRHHIRDRKHRASLLEKRQKSPEFAASPCLLSPKRQRLDRTESRWEVFILAKKDKRKERFDFARFEDVGDERLMDLWKKSLYNATNSWKTYRDLTMIGITE
ncbi:hypothetical protein JHK84_040204 [Glycine max]|nr:hypothetical protein JHK84_040204 [Glycine max]